MMAARMVMTLKKSDWSQMRLHICIVGIVALAARLAAQDQKGTAVAGSPAARKASFQGLGDFPDGPFESLAQRVPADGPVVVGNGTSASGKQASD